MKRIAFLLGFIFLIYADNTYADCRGCCSGHGGVVCNNGMTQCADGTPLSAKCSAKGCNKCPDTSSITKQLDATPKADAQKSSESEWYGRVLAIVDGDTINVMHNGSPEKIRLNGIDAPEKDQKYGSQATVFAFQMVNNENVKVCPISKDKYARTIAWVYVGDKCLNEELLKEGLAWHYKQYSSDQNLSDLESAAREKKIGLWSDPNPIAPWDFRHGNFTPPEDKSSGSSATEMSYHGNIDSKIFHRPGCRYYNCKNCITIFKTIEQAINAGYRPCKICSP